MHCTVRVHAAAHRRLRRAVLAAWLVVGTALPAAAQRATPSPPRRQPPACTDGRTALVLSGGGAKGLAHIGLLLTLDSLGVKPDLIVGSSMGAIVGAMYASGFDARTIDSLARRVPLGRVLNTFEPRAARELGRLQPLVTWEEGDRGIGIQTTAVREEVVNTLTNQVMLRGNLLARGDFDSLPTPFRAVATDLRTRNSVVIGRGDLAEAVRASFAIPLVFRPVQIGDTVLADGGLSANVPIAAARASGATRVLVSDVSERVAPDSADLKAVVGIADRLVNFLFLQPLEPLGADDLYLRTPLPNTPSLGFAPEQVARTIARGRAVADSMIGEAVCLPYGRRDSTALPTRIGEVAGGEAEVALALGLQAGGTLEYGSLLRRIGRFQSDLRFRSVWLAPRRQEGGAVGFAPRVVRAPKRSGHLGFVYDSDLGGRAFVGAVSRHLLGSGAVGSVLGNFGELQRELRAAIRLPLGSGSLAAGPLASLRGTDEELRRFDADGVLQGELDVREVVGVVGFEVPVDQAWTVQAGLLGRWWREPEFGDGDALGAAVRIERFNGFAEPLLTADVQVTAAYRRALLDVRWRARLGGVRVAPRLRVAAGDSVPVQLTTTLGGLEEGFPGLRFGELRGDREVMAGVAFDRRLAGPLFVRVEGAVGRQAVGGALLARSGWLAGARGGLALETVLGPIRAEYGATTTGRRAFFIRFARWIPHQEQ